VDLALGVQRNRAIVTASFAREPRAGNRRAEIRLVV
jgi:hypothetical protein